MLLGELIEESIVPRNIVWRGRKEAGLRSRPIPSNTTQSGFEKLKVRLYA